MKGRRTGNQKRTRTAILLLLLLMVLLFAAGWALELFSVPEKQEGVEPEEPLPLILTEEQTASLAALTLNSSHVVLLTADGETRLMDRGGAETIYPASITKVMTALVVLDSGTDLDAQVTLDAGMFDILRAKHASLAGYSPGETATVRDLLYGAMLPSGAECSQGLAAFLAGSEDAFAERMNTKAQELGMTGSYFVNTSGLHNDIHYSTAEDLARLLTAAIQNETFREIMTTQSYTSTATEQHPQGLTFGSTVLGSLSRIERTDTGILGGKTGYTPQAGLCLASLMTVSDREYILITTGAPGNPWTEPLHIRDACSVYDCLVQIGL